MIQTLKLVLYYFGYQILCTMLVIFPTTWMQLAENGFDMNQMNDAAFQSSTTSASIALILSGIAMTWHLIHFGYVKFNRNNWTEVPFKTIALSIPFVVSSMVFENLCSEFMELPDWMQESFLGMSRNVFGIISITIMAPLVEELLFRGAIQGHLLRIGFKPVHAIFIASAVFGIVHMNPAQIPFAFAIGLIFGWLYYRTGSVIPGMVGHFINNSIAALQMALMTEEEFNTKTIEWLGEWPTYLLFATSFAIMVGMFLYLRKKLPAAPQY